MTAAPRGMHFAGRAQIEGDDARASVRSQLIFFEASMTETRLAIYDDDVVKVDGQWRFQSRRCRFLTPDGLSDRPAKG
jgi:SnoaL-like domain